MRWAAVARQQYPVGRLADCRPAEGTTAIDLVLPRLQLGSGRYLFSFSVHSADHRTQYHRVTSFPADVGASGGVRGRAAVGQPLGMDGDMKLTT
jgi:hypothetical protein